MLYGTDSTLTRFGFNIRTKSGQRVDNIQIMAATLVDAERRLRQMYVQCEIIGRREQTVAQRGRGVDLEGAMRVVGAAPSLQKPGTH